MIKFDRVQTREVIKKHGINCFEYYIIITEKNNNKSINCVNKKTTLLTKKQLNIIDIKLTTIKP